MHWRRYFIWSPFLQVLQHEFGPLKILCRLYKLIHRSWFYPGNILRQSTFTYFTYMLVLTLLDMILISASSIWFPRVCICMILKCLTLWFIPVMIFLFKNALYCAKFEQPLRYVTDFNNWHSWSLLMLFPCTYWDRLWSQNDLVWPLEKMDGRRTIVR